MSLPLNAEQFYAAKLAFEVDAADVQALLATGEDIVLLDARSIDAFQQETIPGAINLSHRLMSAERLATLAPEPLYISFCDGIGCNASTKGALKLAAAGFKVKELQGGVDWWKRDGYPTVAGDDDTAARSALAAISCHC